MSRERRIVITQSNYIPWRGYFDLIDDADVLVVYDDMQYTRRDWRNRNKIRTALGLQWLTVPVKYAPRDTPIDLIEIDFTHPWARQHQDAIMTNYRNAPCFAPVFERFRNLLERAPERLSQLNLALIRWIMESLSIKTEIIDARSLQATGRRTDRLIDIVRKLDGTVYLSGPSASSYIDIDAFRAAGLGLEYKSYVYPEYPQRWSPFLGAVSILDLMFNVGLSARDWLKSHEPNVRVA